MFFYRLSDWVEILQGFTKFNFKLNLKVSAFYLEKQKSFIPKKIFFKPLSISKQKSFVYWLNFPGRFWVWHHSLHAIIGALYHKLQYLFLSNSSLRWDALKAHQHNLTAFAYLRKHGVSIPSVTPVFPPITALYYWSIIS